MAYYRRNYQSRPAKPRKADVRIEYPSRGATYSKDLYGVYAYGVYPSHSVLAGQEMRTWKGQFETLAEAKAAFPEATGPEGVGYRPPYLGHLPEDDDYDNFSDADPGL